LYDIATTVHGASKRNTTKRFYAFVRFKEVKRTSNEKKRYKVKKMIKSNFIFSSRMDSLLN
jgi:hypothetical protein